jgi:hypothetical protein
MDAVTIINRALARIGCLPVQSIAAPGPAGVSVVATYDAVLEDLLSKYPWHFTKRFAALSRLTKTPPGWTYAFMLPPNRLALPRGYYDGPDISGRPLLSYQLATNEVFANASQVYAEFQVKPPVAHWPGYFRELVTLALGAEYALEIREDGQLRNFLRRDAYGPPDFQGEGGQFKVAADLDAQAQPSQQPAGGANPLTDLRNGWDDPDDARYGW